MMQPVPNTDQICAVIVSHDAGLRIQRVVDTLSEQVGHVVIVDNASKPSDRRVLRDLGEARGETLTLLLNEENCWLAAALNQGIAWADAHGYDFVLLSSDTDIPGAEAVKKMLSVFADANLGRVGSVNPRVVLGSLPPESETASPPVDCELLVTGGCLVSMEAIREVGPQREDFLVDMIDYDFGFRLQRAGYRTLELTSVAMAYELGRTTTRRFLWRTCKVHNYSGERRYYFARNGLTLVRESGNKSLARFYRHFLVTSIAKILIYENDKIPKLRMILRGLRDSLRGRLGPLDPVGD